MGGGIAGKVPRRFVNILEKNKTAKYLLLWRRAAVECIASRTKRSTFLQLGGLFPVVSRRLNTKKWR